MSKLYLPLVATPVSVWPLPSSCPQCSPTPDGTSNSGSGLLLLLLCFLCQVHQWLRTFPCPTPDLSLATLPFLHLHTSSTHTLLPLLHFLQSHFLQSWTLLWSPDLTLVKSTSNPYLSCSDLVPFTAVIPAFPPSSLYL